MGKTEDWQYEFQTFRRADGGKRTQRKLKWDLCPVCSQEKKNIRAAMCRRCYEAGGDSWVKNAADILGRILEAVDAGTAVKSSTINHARMLLRRAKEGSRNG